MNKRRWHAINCHKSGKFRKQINRAWWCMLTSGSIDYSNSAEISSLDFGNHEILVPFRGKPMAKRDPQAPLLWQWSSQYNRTAIFVLAARSFVLIRLFRITVTGILFREATFFLWIDLLTKLSLQGLYHESWGDRVVTLLPHTWEVGRCTKWTIHPKGFLWFFQRFGATCTTWRLSGRLQWGRELGGHQRPPTPEQGSFQQHVLQVAIQCFGLWSTPTQAAAGKEISSAVLRNQDGAERSSELNLKIFSEEGAPPPSACWIILITETLP